MTVQSAITGSETGLRRALLQPFTPVTAFLFGLVGCIAFVQADEAQPNPTQTTDSPAISILEGKSFTGELGLVGKPALSQDFFVFREGMFVSEECARRCGYTEAPYWLRLEGSTVQFKSDVPCLKSDATMAWSGTVRGDEVEGTITWISKRWYWTIEKEFWFKGKLVETDVATTE